MAPEQEADSWIQLQAIFLMIFNLYEEMNQMGEEQEQQEQLKPFLGLWPMAADKNKRRKAFFIKFDFFWVGLETQQAKKIHPGHPLFYWSQNPEGIRKFLLDRDEITGRGSSVGKWSWIKVPQKRCNWTDMSLIPGCGLGGGKNPCRPSYEANIKVSAQK